MLWIQEGSYRGGFELRWEVHQHSATASVVWEHPPLPCLDGFPVKLKYISVEKHFPVQNRRSVKYCHSLCHLDEMDFMFSLKSAPVSLNWSRKEFDKYFDQNTFATLSNRQISSWQVAVGSQEGEIMFWWSKRGKVVSWTTSLVYLYLNLYIYDTV